jgi:sugar phosphate isomerase/epimerase
MKIGIQTRPWGPDMNRRNLAQILAEVATAGYDGFEIGAQHLDISQPQSFRRLVADHALQVIGIHVGGEIYDQRAVREALDNIERTSVFAAHAGAPFLPFSGRPKPDKTEADYRRQAENLNRIGKLCHGHGVRLCYHNHFWEIENDCTELRYLCEHTDPGLVWLCLDVGWVERAGGSPVKVANEFLERVAYFHLKDTKDEVWMEVGYGTVDFAGLFQLVEGRDLAWSVVEQDETQRVPVDSARMSREYLKRQLGV